jgi:hypothetical protein
MKYRSMLDAVVFEAAKYFKVLQLAGWVAAEILILL